jgi:hypothetical protein
MSVSADAPDDAWAVGYTITNEQTRSYTSHWDGTSWVRVASPSPDWGDLLCSVIAFGPDDVWAAGQRRVGKPGGIPRSLVMHYDGATWSMVHIKDDSALAARKWSIAGTSSNDVWVAGEVYHGEEGPSKLALEHWNGTKWKFVNSPLSRRQQRGNLWAVDAYSPTAVLAVGGREWTDDQLAEAMTDSTWHGLTCAGCGSDTHLAAASMDSPTTGWVVGHATGALIERWTDRTLTPVDGAVGQRLYAVDTLSPTDAWTVGTTGGLPISEHWDGSTWSQVRVAGTGTLTGVAMQATDDVWTVGYRSAGDRVKPVIRHWDGTAWS